MIIRITLVLVLSLIVFGPPASAQTDNDAVYIVTYIDVQSGSRDEGMSLVKQYRQNTQMERGNSATSAVQEIGRPNRFVVIEVWKDQSFDTHEKAGHTMQFRSRLKAIHNSPADQRVHRGFAQDPRASAADGDVIVVVTHVDVPPQRMAETEVLLKSLAEESRKDNGNLCYEVFQQAASRNHFTVVAVWKDSKTFNSYETKPNTRQFRTALAPMLGAPYDERLYKQLN